MKKIILILLLIATANVYSQVTSAKIKGVVTDDNDEAMLGANVVVLHVPTGTVSGSVTNEKGRYTIQNLRVGGPYEVTFSFVGYESYKVSNIFLNLGKTTNVNGKLSEGGETLDEIVISSSKSKTFNNDRTGAQTSVGNRELKTLPAISRSTADFTRLEPSSSSNGSFGGRNNRFNNFSLDGSIFNNPFGLDAATPGGQTSSQPVSIDAIEQISVSIAPYDVTQSGFTGASVNAVTKSGTNKLSGTVYDFFRNENLTGGRVKNEKVFKPKLSQNQYGISIGGPIIKNKLFFFINFEKDERTDLGSSFLPNRGAGAINESRVLISDLDLVSNILKQVNIGDGQKYNPGAYEGYTFDANSTKGIIKIDWNANEKHRMSIIYNFLRASKEKPAHPTALGFRGPSFTTLQFENAGYKISNNLDSFLWEINSNFSNSISNKLQVGYTHFDDFRNPLSTPGPSISILNKGSNYIIAGHEPFSIHNVLDQKVIQITNNLNYSRGNHNYTFGVSFEKFQFDNSFNLVTYGAQGVFSPTGDISSFRDTKGNKMKEIALVKFYQDAFDTAINTHKNYNNTGVGVNGGWALAETNVGQFSFYIQDEWNINDSFKLTYGIRFDKPLYFDSSTKAQEVIDRSCCYQPTIDYFNPNTKQTTKLNSIQMPTGKILISPRVGFNWDVNDDNTFQVRGGSGLFTGRLPFVWIGNQIGNPNSDFYQAVDPAFQFPQVWRTNIGVDYKFKNGLVASTDISYTKDLNGAHVQNWALRNPSETLEGVDNRPYYVTNDKVKRVDKGEYVNTNAYVFTNSNKGRSFNWTAKIEKSFYNGLYVNLAYNYLNSKDVNSIEAEITADAFAFNPVYGNSNDDVLAFSKYGDTHRVIGVISKKFTYGKNGNIGTTITTFLEYSKGGRFNYTYGGDINNDGSDVNDLLYIPTDTEIDEMTFDAKNNSAENQKAGLKSYISQDDYLSGRRGNYVERYGALAPWRGKWDVKILQDFKIRVSKEKSNTIQLSIDILNFGNLLSSNWGLVQQVRNLQPIGVSVDESRNPTYVFNPDLKETFTYDSGLQSRWQVQFGLRYIF